jgi:hypothetical protein
VQQNLLLRYCSSNTTLLVGTCSFDVTVRDTEPPTSPCPTNIAVANDEDNCGASVVFETIRADNCGIRTVEQTSGRGVGDVFPIGTESVGLVATDTSGNVGKAYQLKVIDMYLVGSLNCASFSAVFVQRNGYRHSSADNHLSGQR